MLCSITQNSDILVLTAGLPRKTGVSRDDLQKINAEIIKDATYRAIAYLLKAIVIVVTNSLDVMTYLAWQVSKLAPNRVMGMAALLDAARFQAFTALEIGVSVTDVRGRAWRFNGAFTPLCHD